jgi:hypothetical protein
MPGFLETFRQEWPVIREAPWSVGAIAIAAAVASMAFIKLIDSSTIVAKDATIQTLTTENGEYKDKLSGKTPDEAKAQFDAMDGQILELEEKISTIGARHLKDHEKMLLIEVLDCRWISLIRSQVFHSKWDARIVKRTREM